MFFASYQIRPHPSHNDKRSQASMAGEGVSKGLFANVANADMEIYGVTEFHESSETASSMRSCALQIGDVARRNTVAEKGPGLDQTNAPPTAGDTFDAEPSETARARNMCILGRVVGGAG